jgi:hypothetical protein
MLIFYILLFGVVYLAWCDFVMEPTKEQRVCIRCCANLGKSVTETLTMIRQAFREESMSCTWVFEWHAQFRAGRTSIENDQHTGRPISCTTPDTCQTSVACSWGSTSNHSRPCRWDWNWLWDMPTDSDCWIGRASCCCLICAQDSDSWLEAAACQRLQGASSDHLWRCSLLIQGYHWWRELDLQLWPGDKATVLPMEKSKLTKTEKGKTGEQQSQEHAHRFLWHQGNCSQRICPGRPNGQFRILLWRFTVTVWRCAKTSPLFHQGIFDQKQHDCHPPPTRHTGLGPPATFVCLPDLR